MGRMTALSASAAFLAAGAVSGVVQPAGAETLVENSAEFRFQLDFHVTDEESQRHVEDALGYLTYQIGGIR